MLLPHRELCFRHALGKDPSLALSCPIGEGLMGALLACARYLVCFIAFRRRVVVCSWFDVGAMGSGVVDVVSAREAIKKV